MHSIEITDDQYDRITALREELADRHADRYASVTLPDSVAYLLDLADTVDDPDRTADVGVGDDADHADEGGGDGEDSADEARSFPREALEAELTERNRRHTDPEATPRMDLYDIAAEYEVSGRSSMTKDELVAAIAEAVERRYTDPLAPVDVDVSGLSPEDPGRATEDGETGDDEASVDGDSDGGATDDDNQLDAVMSLLETHEDKWRSADGDARYEVDLPDGSVEAVRTKDDVRAVLFRNY